MASLISRTTIRYIKTTAASSVVSASSENGIWARRLQLREPKLQRDQAYYAPEWDLETKSDRTEGFSNPLRGYGVTPEKWEYYNKVVWPPNYVVPETGLPKPKEVFHVRESLHFSPKRMWTACQLVWKMDVDDAITQLKLQQLKGCTILAEVLEEAKKRASEEFHIEHPSGMYVADAFPVQSNIVKGARRHAHENWCTIRYRYINIFVRLEEGPAPSFKKRNPEKSGFDKMNNYYNYLRSRTIKNSI